MTRRLDVDLLVALLILAAFLAIAWTHDDAPPAAAATPRPTIARSAERTVQGKGIEWWARRAVQARKDANARARTIRRLRHVIRVDVTIQDAIDLAAVAYQVDRATLSRKASCESTGGHGYRATARNLSSGALGLFQFLPSTWRSTPFARFSPYDPLAASLAAGWMHSAAVHRGREWQCQ